MEGAPNGGSSAEPGAMNGMTEEELERLRMRPADVEADIREMARRKRVEAILNSKSFRTELDRLVEAGLIEGNSVGGCLQQITDMMTPAQVTGAAPGGQCVQPVADLRGAEAAQFSKEEKMLRCKLASLFRVIDLFGWSPAVGGHITVRIVPDVDEFLVNPYGLLYSEITASNLLKVDGEANLLHPGTSGLGVSRPAYTQHAALHAARPQLACVARVLHPAVVTVSALRAGLLPLTEDACVLGAVSLHSAGDGNQLVNDLGPENKVVMVKNRGAFVCGDSIEETYFLLARLIAACENQVRMMPLGVDNLALLDEERQRRVYQLARQPPQQPPAGGWRLGQLEFEAVMRQLDAAGCRTGHIYRHPQAAGAAGRQSGADPAFQPDSDDSFMYSPMRKLYAGARTGERNRWLASALQQKVEIVEGPDAKTVTTKTSVVHQAD